MSRLRIDPVAADQVRQILTNARAHGTDPVRLLDANGFLRYGAKTRQDHLAVIDMVITALEQTPPDRLKFNRIPQNPIDLRNVLVEFLNDLRDGLARTPVQ